MKLPTDPIARPQQSILLPKHADANVQRRIADFCEDLRAKENDKLGFIPAQSYVDAQLRDRMIVELENDEPCGFTFWAQRKKVLRIHQCAVVEDVRRVRHATTMVAELLNHPIARRCRQLRLRVAHDLPANLFWQSLGCRVEQQQPGGYTWRRTINVYRLDLGKRMQTAAQLIDAATAAHRNELTATPPLDDDVWRRRKDRATQECDPSSRRPKRSG